MGVTSSSSSATAVDDRGVPRLKEEAYEDSTGKGEVKIPPPLPPADGFSSHQPFPRRILIDDDTSSPSSLILRCAAFVYLILRLKIKFLLFILTLIYLSGP